MNTDTIDGQILDIMLRAGSRWVLWLLIALSLMAVAVIADRVWFFIQERKPVDRLAKTLETLRTKGPAEALKLLAGSRGIEATVVRACLERAADGPDAV